MYEKMLSGRTIVWLTYDKRRIPVYMESENLLEQVNAVLEFVDIKLPRLPCYFEYNIIKGTGFFQEKFNV